MRGQGRDRVLLLGEPASRSGLPTIHDPDRYWDPVMAAANDLEHGRVACTSARRRACRRSRTDAPFMANLAWGAIRTVGGDALLAVQRLVHPLPEPQDRACPRARSAGCRTSSSGPSRSLDKQRYWVQRGVQFMELRRPDEVDLDTLDVRELFREHVFGCFIDDAPRHRQHRRDRRGQHHVRDRLPAHRLDLARTASSVVQQHRSSDLPRRVQYKILRGNAERLYRFTPAEPPVLAHA